jgi:DNA mismatch repair protein MutL
MSSIIQALPTDVVNLIAAGEVIDSLAAVVRELVENAIDAGATRIAVSLWTEQWRVQVADNGKGMSLADLEQAAIAHSTSKIQSSRDLWHISSLGFRGEALHSLAQLAQLELCSRAISSTEGWRVQYTHQGEPAHIEPIAIAPGTIVTVSDLFGNWLPRREGLPPLPQQLRTLQLVIQQLALCHPAITWQVQQNDRDWFCIWAGASAQQILPQILRDVQLSDLQEVKVGSWGSGVKDQGSGVRGEEEEVKEYFFPAFPARLPSTLLLGLPDRCHRRRPDWIKVAINGRVVRVAELEQTILNAFRRTLPRDRYPVCFLHLQLPPEQVDWNRHPAKADIYLHHLEQVQQAVIEAIDRAIYLDTTPPDAAHLPRIRHLIKTAEAEGHYRATNQDRSAEQEITEQEITEQEKPNDESNPTETDSASHPSLLTPRSSPLTPLKALAQVHKMYILAEHPTGVWLVEQHIAHERVLYEQLSDRWKLVSLNSPLILNELSAAQQEQLQRIGVEVEPFGDRLWAARSVPEALAAREDCVAAILELSLGGDLEAALVATACRTAIRNGMTLSLAEMQTLLDQWQQTRNPRTCPHGRPIYLPLQESSLSRFFRRHWVIGKSHGI